MEAERRSCAEGVEAKSSLLTPFLFAQHVRGLRLLFVRMHAPEVVNTFYMLCFLSAQGLPFFILVPSCSVLLLRVSPYLSEFSLRTRPVLCFVDRPSTSLDRPLWLIL